ncbi:acyl-CoA reductase [Streptomyces sp. NPDC051940]|uniref:acyl-CoA reductase n=1 Tax=Streptomyces sp. NPDC051940 TaxID=3155675 RepID=UPI00343F69C3
MSAAPGHVRVLRDLAEAPPGGPLRHGDVRVLAWLDGLGSLLRAPATARRHPELGPLGAFLGSGRLRRLLDATDPRAPYLRRPRGLVLHIPPANVDGLLVYGWALSALAGNSNIVRIPTGGSAASEELVALVRQSLAEADPAVGHTQRPVRYGHDAQTTAAYSYACDLRVIWGGDATVTALRGHPLRPRARDLTFPDRSSFVLLSAAGWRRADADGRREAAAALYRDALWFDQDACASPRTVIWAGADPGSVSVARAELRSWLTTVSREGPPQADASRAVHQRVTMYSLAADGTVPALSFTDTGLAFAELGPDTPLWRGWAGPGTFVQRRIASLDELPPLIRPSDQTLAHWGLERPELDALAELLAPYGIDRIVPLGQALDFDPVWDGYDLLHEFSRLTALVPYGARAPAPHPTYRRTSRP